MEDQNIKLRKNKRFYVFLWNFLYEFQNKFSKIFRCLVNLKKKILPFILLSLIALNIFFFPECQDILNTLFSNNTVDDASPTRWVSSLNSLFLCLGSSLIGATAIVFSLVMFAMQVNVERMPHGLFLKFSQDVRLIGAFGLTFFLSMMAVISSLLQNPLHMIIAFNVSIWAVLLIVLLFLYAYKRALTLINPLEQLHLIVKETTYDMEKWAQRVKKITPLPLFEEVWISKPIQSMQHIISFARRYAEQRDYEVSKAALTSLVQINNIYIKMKGKTFVAANIFPGFPLSDNVTIANDKLINNTLEILRENIQIAVVRGDEREIRQTLHTLKDLAQLYIQIEYLNSPLVNKTHAGIASWYLADATHSLINKEFFDLAKEGLLLMGEIAGSFLSVKDFIQFPAVTEKIQTVVCSEQHILNKKYLPVIQNAVTQLSTLTLNLLCVEECDISSPIDKIKEKLAKITEFVLLRLPQEYNPSDYLEPYYSCTSQMAFIVNLKKLISNITPHTNNHELVKRLGYNVALWARGVYKIKDFLQYSVIKKADSFTFDILCWIEEVVIALINFSNIPASASYSQELRTHARWLFCSFSYLPNDKSSLEMVVGKFDIAEKLFKITEMALRSKCIDIVKDGESMILVWAFKNIATDASKDQSIKSFIGLSVLSLLRGSSDISEDIKKKIAVEVNKLNTPTARVREEIASGILEEINTTDNKITYLMPEIKQTIKKVDFDKLKHLLNDVAAILRNQVS